MGVRCLLLALRMSGGWIGLRWMHRKAQIGTTEWQHRIGRMAKALGLWRSPRLLLSNQIHSPLVMGWVRPLLLMPAGLLAGLDPNAVEALLAHELAHIRRHDYLVNLIQCMVEILLFYHPAVWWISARVRAERELCCDDVAVGWCDDPQLYAETLNRLHELRSQSLSLALGADGGILLFRIKRLLIPSPIQSRLPRRFNLVALVCSMTLLLSAGFATRLLRAETPITQWHLSSNEPKEYQFTMDPSTTHSGNPSLRLSRGSESLQGGCVTIMQERVPTEFLGKRVRMGAWVKAEDVTESFGFWMDWIGAASQWSTCAYDRGTQDWQRLEVVTDIAADTKTLSFGFELQGKGSVWMDDFKFEMVDSHVPGSDNRQPGIRRPFPSEFSPADWVLTGSKPQLCITRLDSKMLHNGKPSYLLASTTSSKDSFGMLMQHPFSVQSYLGKRIRLSAWMKSENVRDLAGLYMSAEKMVNRNEPWKCTAYDSHQIHGTSDWQKVDIVLDVAVDSTAIFVSMDLHGEGNVWMAEPNLEIVDESVPVTHLTQH